MKTRIGGLLALGLALGACGTVEVKLDSKSGGDAARDQAMAVFVERTVTDRLDAPGGDHTDWKYIDILDKGRLRIEVSFDNPELTKGGEVEFTDEFGSRLDRQIVTPGQSNYIFAREVEKVPNKFFVKVFTREGRTVYTVGSSLAYAPEPAPPPPPVAEPEPEPEPVRKRKRRTTRRKPVKKPPVKKPPVTKPPPTPEPVAAPVIIKGTVIRAIPSDDKQSVEVTIRLSSDAAVRTSGVKAYKGGSFLAPVKVLKVSGRTVKGIINEPPGKVTGRIEVRFSPR